MAFIRKGYLARYQGGHPRKGNSVIRPCRDWWLVKHRLVDTGQINVNRITLPKEYVGKRVRFKVEVIEDEE